ncbi:hypothetical protein [Frankia sp. Cr1]|uniref:hypothetical protein n=1 Tax=Frankia sp. Cr1 TaxID=3073931 RepID=UPI002AD4F547|nr:hypothetical protein [Frankia sp. Cr1]
MSVHGCAAAVTGPLPMVVPLRNPVEDLVLLVQAAPEMDVRLVAHALRSITRNATTSVEDPRWLALVDAVAEWEAAGRARRGETEIAAAAAYIDQAARALLSARRPHTGGAR